jgi:hypothetical protein
MMMQNPFLVIRYASFCGILFLNLITLIFAAWNVAITKSTGQAAPGASVLLLFNGSLAFVSVFIALAELVVVKVKTAKVKYECIWTGILAVLQLSAALAITASGPPVACRPDGDLSICTSVTILVPVAWLSSFTTVVYFLLLSISTFVYAPCYPGIWRTSVYDVPWFLSPDAAGFSLPHKSPSSSTSTMKTSSSATLRDTPRIRGIWDHDEDDDEMVQSLANTATADAAAAGGDAHARRSCFSSLRVAPWARAYQSRRGLDRPFATRSQVLAANPGLKPLTLLPTPPPKTAEAGYPLPIASRYMGLPPDAFKKDRKNSAAEKDPRPNTLSQWVRADIAEGRNVHTRPPITPH